MAPDLNSVPSSPLNPRQTSTTSGRPDPEPMAPPPASPSSMLPHPPNRDSGPSAFSGFDSGPGPLRHPRPLTAADLHMQLEKEQEAVVNRLTRELSLLRQQTASVASTTSSTSTGLPDSTDHSGNHLISGPSHPTPSRRHRSSSSLSTRSANTAATTASGLTGMSGSTVGTTGGIAGSTISGIAPARDSALSRQTHPGDSLSRNGSVASRRSQASSPSLASSLYQGDQFPNLHPHRQSNPPPPHQQAFSSTSNRSSYTLNARYEEVTHQRAELELVKRENENLRRRIRDLERSLSSRRHDAGDRLRSDSASTGISIRSTAVGNTQDRVHAENEEEDGVKVGESAGSIGVGGGH
ncbi:hypothetical protein G7Y79_00041g077590 [Physcia stellaris]|nr:hypothetical protein G7Y79_00041g077590 [Physcia stellaris]